MLTGSNKRILLKRALEEKNASDVLELASKVSSYFTVYNSEGDNAFHIIIKYGNLSQLRHLINIKPFASNILNIVNNRKRTPLHEACVLGKMKMAMKLLSSGASFKMADIDGNFPLHLAAKSGNHIIISKLCASIEQSNKAFNKSYLPTIILGSIFDINVRNKLNQTAYRIAKAGGKRCERTAGILASFGGKDNFELAKQCIYQDDIQGLRTIVKKDKTVITDSDEENNSLMHHAVLSLSKKSKQIILMLIKAGANINAINKAKQTPLFLVATLELWKHNKNLSSNLFTFLVAKGADVKHADSKGFTALHYAALQGDVWVIDQLIKHGAVVNHISNDGLTALHLAALYNRHLAFKALVRHQANINIEAFPRIEAMIQNPNHAEASALTPLRLAMEAHAKEVMKEIIDCKIKSKDTSELLYAQTSNEHNLLCYFDSAEDKTYFDKLIAVGCIPIETTPDEGMIHRTYQYISGQLAFSSELEQTNIYNVVNIARMLVPALTAYAAGPVVMGLQLGLQFALYSTPALRNKASAAYYYLKPFIHNNMHWMVDDLFDTAATLSSTTVSASFNTMRALDYLGDPVRRFSGIGTSLLLANLARHYTDNKEIQAAAYFAGQIGGMLAVDGYRHYRQKQAQPAQQEFDMQLQQGLDIWTTLLGKSKAENFVSVMHSITDLQSQLYDAVGWLEHAVVDFTSDGLQSMLSMLEGLESFQALNGVLQEGTSLLQPLAGYLYNPQDLFTKAQMIQQEINFYRERALQEIEGWIYDNVIPHGEYIQCAKRYLMYSKNSLLFSKKQNIQDKKTQADNELVEAEKLLKLCLENEATLISGESNSDAILIAAEKSIQAQERVRHAKEKQEELSAQLDAISSRIEENDKEARELWESSSKGIKETNYSNCELEKINARIKYEDAKLDKEYNDSHDITAEEKRVTDERLYAAELELKSAEERSIVAESELVAELSSYELKHFAKSKEVQNKSLEEKIAALKESKTNRISTHDKLSEALQNEQAQTTMHANAENQLLVAIQNFEAAERIYDALIHPNSLIINDVVFNAFRICGFNDSVAVANYIINEIVKTGIITLNDANKRMFDTIITAQDSSRGLGPKLTTIVTNHWNLLFSGDYRQNIINQYQNSLNALNISKEAYEESLRSLQQAKIETQRYREQYEQILPVHEQQDFSKRFQSLIDLNELQDWSQRHPNELVERIVGLIGQPNITLEAAQYLNQSVGSNQMNRSICNTIAQWLIEYKYLFLNAPNVDLRTKEVAELSNQLQATAISPTVISQATSQISSDIANGLLHLAIDRASTMLGSRNTSNFNNTVAQIVQSQIQRGLTYHSSATIAELKVGDQLLTEALSQSLSENNQELASSAILQSLKDNTLAGSIQAVGQWQPYVPPQPVTTDSGSEHHGISRFLRSALKTILNNGVSVGGDSSGIYGGVTNGNMIRLVSFNTPVQVLFTLPQRQLTNDPANLTVPASLPSYPLSVNPLPSVLPKPTWEPLNPTPGLVNPEQFRVVPDIPKVVPQPQPVLPLSTYLPSLSMPLKPLLFSQNARNVQFVESTHTQPLENDAVTHQSQSDTEWHTTRSGKSWNKLVDTLGSFGEGVKETFVETGVFLGEEAARLRLGENTHIGDQVRNTGRFIGEEFARFRLGEELISENCFNMFRDYMKEDFQRALAYEDTLTGTIVKEVIENITKSPIENIANELGKLSGLVLLPGFGLFSELKLANRGTKLITEIDEIASTKKIFTYQYLPDLKHDLRLMDWEKEELHAITMYQDFRALNYDVPQVAYHLNVSPLHAQRVKDHLFINKHIFADRVDLFSPDYKIATFWQNCINGVHTPADIKLFQHELFEATFEMLYKTDYNVSHTAANRAGYISGLNPKEVEAYVNNSRPKKNK